MSELQLKNLTIIRLLETSRNVEINIEQKTPYPYPATFIWTKNKYETLVSDYRRKFSYPIIFFRNLLHSDSGNYSVEVINYYNFLSKPTGRPFSKASLTFTLDILCE